MNIAIPNSEFEDFKRFLSISVVLTEEQKKELLKSDEVRVKGE